MEKLFKNRIDAGEKLSLKLLSLSIKNPFVLGIPRGGVPVGRVVAQSLSASFSVIVARKIGSPQNPELGIGAISENDVFVLNQSLVRSLKIKRKEIEEIKQNEEIELVRRVLVYRNGLQLPSLKGDCAVLVDDGLATGITAKAAILAVKKCKPESIVLAAPVCSQSAINALAKLVNNIVYLHAPAKLSTIGEWYEDFRQVTDAEVLKALQS